MSFREISKEEHFALVQINKDNKTRFRKTAINSLAELNHNGFPDRYKYILISILKLLGVEINIVQGDSKEEVLLHLDSRYEIVWRIINEYTSLVKLAVGGDQVGPGDKILFSNSYIDHIKATTPSTAVKTIILVAIFNLFSDRKIEPVGSFECKDYYIHKKLNILLNSIVLFDKDKYL